MTLRQAREKRKLTQEQLESISGVAQSVISKIETGDMQSPAWDTVARLCAALNVGPHDVFPVPTAKEAS